MIKLENTDNVRTCDSFLCNEPMPNATCDEPTFCSLECAEDYIHILDVLESSS